MTKTLLTIAVVFCIVFAVVFLSYSQKTFTVKKVVTNGLTLWTESFGNAKKPPLLLIAGAGAPCRFWHDTFCQQLAQHYFVVRYDHRDTGFSSAIDYQKDPYTIYDLTEDALAILDAYNIERCYVVGHSMGGYIAQILGMDFSERIISATSISAGGIMPAPTPLPEEKKQQEETWKVMLDNKFTQDYEESVDGFIKVFHYLHGSVDLDEDLCREYVKDLYMRSNHDVAVAQNHISALTAGTAQDRSRDMAGMMVPLLLLHGERDLLQPLKLAFNVADVVPHAKLVIMPGMGHMIFNKSLWQDIAEKIILFNSSS